MAYAVSTIPSSAGSTANNFGTFLRERFGEGWYCADKRIPFDPGRHISPRQLLDARDDYQRATAAPIAA